jgi:hypothetical protein
LVHGGGVEKTGNFAAPLTKRKARSRAEWRKEVQRALKAELCKMAEQGSFASAIDKMMGLVLGLDQENERISWRLLRALRYRFGRNTEKLDPAELNQLYLA